MEQTEVKEGLEHSQETVAGAIQPQGGGGGCGCQGASTKNIPPSPVYAIGKIEARFPSLAVEKEFAQAIGREKTGGQQTDRQAFHTVLSQKQNRYLVHRLCWVFTVEGLETYLLQPREESGYDLLIEAIRPAPSPIDLDVVVGLKGPLAPPQMCNGLMVPIVLFDQLYSFDREGLVKSIPRPKEIPEKQEGLFRASANELFERIIQLADNAGATDEHRALNYLAVRYPAIYATASECHARNCSLTGVEVRPSRLSGVRKILDVIFSYTHRESDVTEKYFVRVDVTEEFPFLVTKLSPYYDR
ncbi:MAG: hypothetical protein WBK96_05355 [Candidatus Manganitrophaceae bacterium]